MTIQSCPPCSSLQTLFSLESGFRKTSDHTRTRMEQNSPSLLASNLEVFLTVLRRGQRTHTERTVRTNGIAVFSFQLQQNPQSSFKNKNNNEIKKNDRGSCQSTLADMLVTFSVAPDWRKKGKSKLKWFANIFCYLCLFSLGSVVQSKFDPTSQVTAWQPYMLFRLGLCTQCATWSSCVCVRVCLQCWNSLNRWGECAIRLWHTWGESHTWTLAFACFLMACCCCSPTCWGAQ